MSVCVFSRHRQEFGCYFFLPRFEKKKALPLRRVTRTRIRTHKDTQTYTHIHAFKHVHIHAFTYSHTSTETVTETDTDAKTDTYYTWIYVFLVHSFIFSYPLFFLFFCSSFGLVHLFLFLIFCLYFFRPITGSGRSLRSRARPPRWPAMAPKVSKTPRRVLEQGFIVLLESRCRRTGCLSLWRTE